MLLFKYMCMPVRRSLSNFICFSHPPLPDRQVPCIGCNRLLLPGYPQPLRAHAARDPFLRSRWRTAAGARKPGAGAWVPTPICLGEAHGSEQTSAAAAASPTAGCRGVAGLRAHGSGRLWVILYSSACSRGRLLLRWDPAAGGTGILTDYSYFTSQNECSQEWLDIGSISYDKFCVKNSMPCHTPFLLQIRLRCVSVFMHARSLYTRLFMCERIIKARRW